MKMKISLNKLIDERNNRAWTQSHLAEVCDLSLRTIQRIEKTGSASHESIQALASVFEISVEELIYKNPTSTVNQETKENPKGKILANIGLAFFIIIPVLVIFGFSFNNDLYSSTRGSGLILFVIFSKVALLTLLLGIILISISKHYYHYSKKWINKILIIAIIFLFIASPVVAIIVGITLLYFSKTKN